MKRIFVYVLTYLCFSFNSCIRKTENKTCHVLSNKEVCILIINQSGLEINELILKHERGNKNIGRLSKDSKTTLKFESEGENAYKLTVIFENGDTLKSLNNYTEGGYILTEIISRNGIETTYNNCY